ncbi:bone morphogenetic protein receptor type-2 [Drosophila guanche]|uniref:receptor protein serine/threonine kinase n=1 Tax=Drosophila guanche TaxID=7266 RepID=A0A3B0KA12_DROGU|nr:bone morphogenetic protein receptor type-2 [Drosophila guanche]XP_034133945.1 bone morphogenetic protein receptor type-2 [Drosophila guanche]XP_034133946.1 bone morphogenetic protein receptor type-2 [Drosophila guanche]SPP84960.1 blast:Bone morphogenetic protein receptor type-2 [Drosophila guanche]
MNRFTWSWLLVALISLSKSSPVPSRQYSCMSFMENDNSLHDDDSEQDNSGELLEQQIEPSAIPNEPHRRSCSEGYTFCFTLWNQTLNGTRVVKQGCWKDNTDRNSICSQSECTSSAPTSRTNSLYYCCCSGDVCNDQFAVVEPAPLELGSNDVRSPLSNLATSKQQQSFLASTMLGVAGGLTAILIGIILAIQYCRGPKEKPEPEESPLAPSGPGYSSNLRNVDNMNLIGMLGSGKYGTVMKGLLHDQEVAVKIYPEEHHQYYVNERNIYALPLMDCPALLSYFGYDERCTMDGRMEYQLVLSLAPLGCLQDWLIANTLDFSQCCGMLRSITRGISHLHTELRLGDQHKPCVAHRDINTRNVLVQADLSCCIADFGFALKVFGSKYEYKGEVAMAETKSINEVGTLRYMAPELLEGAVNLRDCETSLKQMDVYALGLVLWEVSTRCADFYAAGQMTPPYKAPYEQEVGSHPSFDQMQALVVRHKARPLFPAGWGGGAAAKVVRDTCEDCWDHDADARLTSLCAEERMQEMSGLKPRLQVQPASPLLNTNNLTSPISLEQVNLTTTTTTTAAAVHHQMSSDTAGLLQPPPNQQLPTEKNHLSYTQQQLQPYQGRNPCQERNLAPLPLRPPPVLVERSKKHSFQTQPQENSLSCLEHDVGVEELLPPNGGVPPAHHHHNQKNTNTNSSLGQGFPKQQNTDHKLRGWHGVRALIHKKLFRKEHAEELCRQLQLGEEKSNLVAALKAGSGMRRPNNLDLSPRQPMDNKPMPVQLRSAEQRSGTPAHIVPRSLSSSLIKHINSNSGSSNTTTTTNNNCILSHGNELQTLTRPSSKRRPGHLRTNSLLVTSQCHGQGQGLPTEQQMRRQHSLEVFREVFSGRGSSERLRDPAERVKTPGDVPPSVRKARASKTLSLYDDRMMDSSLLNIL